MIKILKKTFKTLLGILILLSLVFSAFFIYSMLEQYEESVRWGSSSLLSDIHNVPPALAKNYVQGNEEELAQALTDVNNTLDKIEEKKKIPEEKLDDYLEIYQKADKLIKESEIDNDNLLKPLKSLKLYIDTENEMKDAYNNVSTEKLSKYSDQLVSRLNEKDNELDEVYLSRLEEVAKDYKDLESFSKRALQSLGVVEGDTLYVDLKVDQEVTRTILSELSDSHLLKFSNIKRLDDMLQSKPWDDILAHNQSTKEYYSWKESKEILENLLVTNYKPVSDFKMLQDALDYQPYVELFERYGYILDIENSTIDNVYYQGEKLNDNMYIKKGITLTFDIDFSYIEIEIVEPEIIEPEEIEIDDGIEGNIPVKKEPVEERPDIEIDKPAKKPDKKPSDKPVEKPNDKPNDNTNDNEEDLPEGDININIEGPN